ncbi:testis development-related protein isoform X2 [Bufo gargarizans]|uniref:testis development-related protein isoform X2 n=1 Tax=Bufo gargarizans TaxID=30331 RepID=UPI001CF3F8C7|nr:testis development-related protein isoform X2 [Bufo gargarizans]XP_044146002.1 testis development-related protein isoform X2 [Bufo gargarizans]XP_044146003.1 testis development-related protein isoform X2 [Bufo gargarizans]
MKKRRLSQKPRVKTSYSKPTFNLPCHNLLQRKAKQPGPDEMTIQEAGPVKERAVSRRRKGGQSGLSPPSVHLKVQGASFRGWKEVTSIFNKDDEQQLLKGSKSPKSKVASVKTKDEVKTEKKSGFWDSLAIKQNIQPKKADEIEGWEPPQIMVEDPPSFAEDPLDDNHSWQGWEEEGQGSSKYTNLSSSGNSSRWSIKSAGKLVSIRRRSKGNLTENWEELE